MKVALYQARTGIDPDRNAARLVEVCREAADGGAAMLFTPEMSGVLDRDGARSVHTITTEEHDPVLNSVCQAARRRRLWVHLGSLAVRRSDGKLANRAFVIDAEGAVRARYDKMHLFDVDLPTGESWRESARYVPGEAPVVVDTPIDRLGLSVCYDLRFPALYASLAAAGAVVLSVPAAFTIPTGQAHWHVLLRARAIETGSFVVAAAQCGTHEDGRRTYGHSLIVDPWGRVLLDMGEQEDAIGFAEIDGGLVADARAAIPALRHVRPVGPARVTT